MKKLSFVLIVFVLILQACNQNEVYRSYEEFDNQQWAKNSEVTLIADITDDSFNYDLGVSIRYNTGIQHKMLKVKVSIIDPSGAVTEKLIDLYRYDSNGIPIGEEAGGYGDLDKLFEENVELQKGKYTFKVAQNMEPDILGGIMKVGIYINKIEK